jgi:3-hydroxybutyryl-CoA dehydrogenase
MSRKAEQMQKQFKKIGVIGTGKMGSDIFYLFLDNDFEIVCRSINSKEKFENKFLKKANSFVKNGILTQEQLQKLLGRITITSSNDDLKDCDLIIESILEITDTKRSLFKELDRIVKKDAVFVSNSSSILPSKIFSEVERKDRTAGLHFFFPVKMTNIVEIISSDDTSEETKNRLIELVKILKKMPLSLKNRSAFILNKAFINFHAQAFRYYLEESIPIEDIDMVVRENIFPIGAFEFYDNVGLDTIYHSLKEYVETMTDNSVEFVKPMIGLVEKYVHAGYFGTKSGKGFYSKSDSGDADIPFIIQNTMPASVEKKNEIRETLLAVFLNTVFTFVDNGYCTLDEINFAIKEYMKIEKGPLEMAVDFGKDKVREVLRKNFARSNFEAFSPAENL